MRLDREEFKRIIKFGVTGAANTLIDFGVYTLLAVALGLSVPFSQVCGYSAGMLNSYLVNRSWTFRTGERFFSLQLVRFIVGNLAVLLLSVLLINLCTVQLGLGKLTAKLVVTCFTLAVNFLISRLWIFKGPKYPDKRGCGRGKSVHQNHHAQPQGAA